MKLAAAVFSAILTAACPAHAVSNPSANVLGGSETAIWTEGADNASGMNRPTYGIPHISPQDWVTAENRNPQQYTSEGSVDSLKEVCRNLPLLAKGVIHPTALREVLQICALASNGEIQSKIAFNGAVLPSNAAGAFFWSEPSHSVQGIYLSPNMQSDVCQSVIKTGPNQGVWAKGQRHDFIAGGDRFCAGVYVHELCHYRDYLKGTLDPNDVEGNEVRAFACEYDFFSIAFSRYELSYALTTFGPKSPLMPPPSDYTVRFMKHVGDVVSTEGDQGKLLELVRKLGYKNPPVQVQQPVPQSS